MRAFALVLVLCGCGGSTPVPVKGHPIVLALITTGNAVVTVRYDGKLTTPDGGTLARTYGTLADAMQIKGTVETLDAAGTVRATSTYAFGTYCTATPTQGEGIDQLASETIHLLETPDAMGAPQLSIPTVDCVNLDGTGVEVSP